MDGISWRFPVGHYVQTTRRARRARVSVILVYARKRNHPLEASSPSSLLSRLGFGGKFVTSPFSRTQIVKTHALDNHSLPNFRGSARKCSNCLPLNRSNPKMSKNYHGCLGLLASRTREVSAGLLLSLTSTYLREMKGDQLVGSPQIPGETFTC